MTKLDEGILEIVDRVVRVFVQQRKYKSVETDELRNELFVKLRIELLDKPLINNTTERLYKRGMALASGYCRSVKAEAYGEYSPHQFVPSLEMMLVSKQEQIPLDRIKDKKFKLKVWCSSREQRLFKAIDSRVIAYLHFVEEIPLRDIATYLGRSYAAIRGALTAIVRTKESYRTIKMKKNDVVLLKIDNPFFNNMLGRVKEQTDYGAVVVVESHSYPHRNLWELRCTTDEMVYVGSLDDKELIPIKTDGESIPGGSTRKAHAQDIGKFKVVVEATGENCPKCQGFLVRTGSCLTCQSCGESSGGCG